MWCHMLFGQVSNTGLMDTISGVRINKLSVGAYVDAYYGSCSSATAENDVPYFVSMQRNNELNINLAYMDIRYTDHNVRARFAPGVGTYMNANYAAEPGTLKNIVEASAGFRVFKNKEVWIDAGVLGSPYTNESAVSKDHLMYTRSLAPEYVPYYLSGIKISCPVGNKINAYLYLINGWQQIRDNNASKSLGTQVEFRPDNKNLINWNTYLGDERSALNPHYRMRYFTDIYWIHQPEGKFSITSCVYAGNQQATDQKGGLTNHYWWQANFIGRFTFNATWSLSGRVEYFSDVNNIQIVSLNQMKGFKTYSTGLCLNARVNEHALVRLEGRQFFAPESVFYDRSGKPDRNMTWLVSNMTIWF